MDYRQFIRHAISEKSSKNPAYSMRSFARKAGISPSHLSRVLSGKKDLSPAAALRVALEIGLKENQIETFLADVAYRTADDGTMRALKSRLQKRQSSLLHRTLAFEVFKVISDWQHLPLFELIKLRPLRSESWMARKLGLSILEVKSSLDRLTFVGLIERTIDGYAAIEKSELQTTDDISNSAIRKHHEQMSKKATEALSQSVHEREFQSLQLAFNGKDISRAQKCIREFVACFEEEFKTKDTEDIYQMNVQFFKLTRKLEEK